MYNESIEIRSYQASDSLSDLTAMLHRAYAPLARLGMRYLASHQDEATTRQRLSEADAQGLVAVLNDQVVGTITLCQPRHDAAIGWYARPEVLSFEQFAVDPEFQGAGIGSRLLDAVEARAKSQRALELACDTSEFAADLITMYQRRGYRVVDSADWEVTNYRSVVLSRRLV